MGFPFRIKVIGFPYGFVLLGEFPWLCIVFVLKVYYVKQDLIKQSKLISSLPEEGLIPEIMQA